MDLNATATSLNKEKSVFSKTRGEQWSYKLPRKRTIILVPIATPRVSPNIPEEPRGFARLFITERQLEILSWVQHGKSARDIGDILGISPRTVEHQLEKVCENLGVRTRFQAVLKVRDLGVLA